MEAEQRVQTETEPEGSGTVLVVDVISSTVSQSGAAACCQSRDINPQIFINKENINIKYLTIQQLYLGFVIAGNLEMFDWF